MCGFVGIAGSGLDLTNKELLRRMRDTLKHRGPDDAGEYFDQSVALGFRRLAILDLSQTGHQPMCNLRGDLWIVFNGEIYNYLELREKLEAFGYQFRGGSDTEVLLALYEHYGTEMFAYVNGMFAFALYDKVKRTVILARDRMGVKPLFYWTSNQQVAFASEIKALRGLPNFPKEIDATALAMYMRLNFVPGAACIFPGVKKVPPAHYLAVSIDEPSKAVLRRYWRVDWDAEVEIHSEAHWLNQIEELLYDAVRLRLRSDVPLGTFLSGGIDSGLIAAMAAKIVGKDLMAFTVSFPGSDSDERQNAEATASHLGISTLVDHVERDALSLLPDLAPHFDEPFADMSLIPTYQICKKMRDHATVILSGDGGDELFGGYLYHPIAWRMRHLDVLPDAFICPILKALAHLAPEGSWLRRNGRRLSLPSRVRGAFYQRDIFETWQQRVLEPDYTISSDRLVAELEGYHCLGQGQTALDRAQAADLQLLLPDNMLVKVDRMSMKASVEVRSPFLDYRFAEMIPRIPPHLRVKNGQGKYLLRRLAERYLPMQVVHGPKRGFDVPAAHWLSGERMEIVRRLLLGRSEKKAVVRREAVDWLCHNVAKHPSCGPAILRILIWNMWAEHNIETSRD